MVYLIYTCINAKETSRNSKWALHFQMRCFYINSTWAVKFTVRQNASRLLNYCPSLKSMCFFLRGSLDLISSSKLTRTVKTTQAAAGNTQANISINCLSGSLVFCFVLDDFGKCDMSVVISYLSWGDQLIIWWLNICLYCTFARLFIHYEHIYIHIWTGQYVCYYTIKRFIE